MANNILVKDSNAMSVILKSTQDSNGVQTPHNNAQLYINNAAVTALNFVPVDGSNVIQAILSISNSIAIVKTGV